MTTALTGEPTRSRPLRLWPGVVVAGIIVLLRFVVPVVMPAVTIYGVIAGVVGGLVIVLWWLFFSRAPWVERVGAIFLMVAATLATKFFIHPSIAGGLMGNMLAIYAIPTTLAPAFVAWAVATRRSSVGIRRWTMAATILLACGVWTLVRTDGVIGGGVAQLKWRWTPTAEERLLAQTRNTPEVLPSAPVAAVIPEERLPARTDEKPLEGAAAKGGALPAPATAKTEPGASAEAKTSPESPAMGERAAPRAGVPATGERAVARVEWPGFRGAERNSVIRGVRIETDWSKARPVELWRRPIGPGWSSFAVHGDFLYTQEQRGENEIVACYKVSTGEPVWKHRDPVRFYESNGGAGPRGTPTLSNGRVYTFGATGILNALDAGTGAVVWSRHAESDTGVKVPGWGFASSPLVVDDLVIVAASGALIAYDRASGERRWLNRSRGGSYSSPHLLTIDGVAQILTLSAAGATSVTPADGKVLWEDLWPGGVPIVQPAIVGGGDILISNSDAMGGMGTRRLAVAHGRPLSDSGQTPRPGAAATAEWTVEERWTSKGLKPYFNDYVVNDGHAYGFDSSILACIDLEDGTRKWKGGRYGQGQLVLLPDQDLLLVLSEDGELALVKATPDQFTELARMPALEGKTWNHPVLVGSTLLVRNGEEMAAFRLSLEGR